MKTIMAFISHRVIYLFIALSLVFLFTILRGPLYEVFVDIQVSPPEEVRRTDFSWITVNEWFNTQAYIITSYSILKDVKSKISITNLRKIVSAKRLGGADVIRIAARSDDNPAELEEVVNNIADLYLRRFNETKKEEKEAAKLEEMEKEERDLALTQAVIKAAGLEKEINTIRECLKGHEAELKDLEAKPAELNEIKGRFEQIEKELFASQENLANLQTVYTDSWPAVLGLKQKIDMLKREKEEFYRRLLAAQGIENKKLELKSKIQKGEEEIRNLQNRLKEADDCLTKIREKVTPIKKKDMPEKKSTLEKVLTPPTLNLLPGIGIRLLLGCPLITFLFNIFKGLNVRL